MAELTLDRLHRMMREIAGTDEPVDPGADLGDVEFADLGYDSLVVLETVTRLGRDLGVQVPDDVVAGFTTPNEVVAYVSRVRAVG
ncbi:acyl carrier protein [Amycolatopsis sp. A133]|jgi:act minimal PKS acyl carrier protein|uniref:acyl carrier protein n=1 Tax=Amycolatopsis sp. A133 TaxID=3064472 RepID=UPI0027FC9394|nr:acyl carrier protein [Amycolatopsis sp. A133]MDQ7803510.1 acyl carrier protein [Amycolatopsis sp. A133]